MTKKANAVDGDNTGFITVNTGTHTVGELEVAGTPLSDYTSSISCDTTPVTAGDGTTLGGIVVAKGTRSPARSPTAANTATIKVVKDFSDNSPAGAKVDLQIDGVTKKANAVDGDNTGFITVNTGTHTVGELEVAGTPLSDYTSSISCDTTPVTAGDGTTLGGIVVAKGDAITCTITNSRNTATIKVVKDFSDNSPAGAKVDLQIDGVTKKANAVDGDNTGFITVNTGTHTVGELEVAGTPLSDYTVIDQLRHHPGDRRRRHDPGQDRGRQG